MQTPENELHLLQSEAQRIRDAGALGRSQNIHSLFDLFVSAALEQRQLREFDVACEVFGKDSRFDPVVDASVRVHVHRLRRKLEEYYASQPGVEPRLHMPKGIYRLTLATQADSERHTANLIDGEAGQPAPTARPPASTVKRPLRWAVMATGWLAALTFCALLVFERRSQSTETGRLEELNRAALWREFAQASDVKMLLLESSTHGPADDALSGLGALAAEPSLPIGVGPALRDLLPIVHHQEDKRQYAMTVPFARLRPEMIKRQSFIYVGFISGLQKNLPSVMEGSNLQIDPATGTIGHGKNGLRYQPTPRDLLERNTHQEFAYLAAIRGPSGNRIIIVTGTANAGLQEAAKLASDLPSMKRLSQQAGNATDFEALYEVRSTGDLGLGAKLIGTWPRQSPTWASD